MTPMSDRNAAAELATRIKASLIDPSKEDEADRPPADKSPGDADARVSEKPASIEHAVDFNGAD